jgi:ATP/maltotriose-dependent transcriptional regulator MalT
MLPAGPATEPGTVRFHDTIAMQRIAAAHALDMGDLATAREWLDAHDRWLAWNGTVLGQSEGQALWARYHHKAGDMERARTHAERTLAHATEPRQPLALLAAHRLLGELDISTGHLLDAAGHLERALALAAACAAPYERALTLLVLAELRAASDKWVEAMAILDEVRAICTPLGAKRALTQADALASRLTTRHPLAPAYPAGLSAREVDVLRLVAAGLMNSEIAGRLFLSERTIEKHLQSVYNKLGSSSRTTATRFAIEHHLV